MALGRKNVSVARANSSADVFRLAGFLGNNNLIHHEAPLEDWIRERRTRTYSEQNNLWLPKIASGLAQMPRWAILASG